MKIDTLQEAWRLIILVFGVTIIALGIALLVLPGPGIIVIIVGLSVLAGHFVWAKRLLDKVKTQLTKGKDFVKSKLAKKV